MLLTSIEGFGSLVVFVDFLNESFLIKVQWGVLETKETIKTKFYGYIL